MRVTFRDNLRAGQLIDFLLGPRLWVPDQTYPDYFDWIQRIEPELNGGCKRHMACVWNGELAGVVVWQRHKTETSWLEIKNITVRPLVSGRMVGSFLLRQAEIEGALEFGSVQSVCDAKTSARDVLGFLVACHYRPQLTTDLYGHGRGPDVVLTRTLLEIETRKK